MRDLPPVPVFQRLMRTKGGGLCHGSNRGYVRKGGSPPRESQSNQVAKQIAMNAKSMNRILMIGAALFLGATGCKQKEKVLDVDTPGGGIEVERDKKSGEVDIKIQEKK